MSPITRLSAMLDAGKIDAVALTRACLARIAGPGRALNAFVTLCPDSALRDAAAAAARARAGARLSPLDGIPVALKDNIDLAGVPTSNGFGGPPWRVPEQDSEIARRLRAAGGVILGKLAMHEGALGATTDNPHHGRCYNPYRAGYSPGGSSGGAGAAVAAGLCAAAVGTDTGGSIRIPASYCGVVGLKPGFGVVPLLGVVPLCERLDHAGPLTRSVADAGVLLAALAGAPPRSDPFDWDLRKGGRLDGVRLAVLENFQNETIAPAVAAAFAAALACLRRLGAHIEPVRLGGFDPKLLRRAAFVRMEVEAARTHGAFAAREPGRFSPAFRACLDYGAHVPAERLLAADQVIEDAAQALMQGLMGLDAIVSPATPQPAHAFALPPPENVGCFAVLANAAGVPAISLPMGADPEGMPLGLQIMGTGGGEAALLALAAAYEVAADWDLRPPGIAHCC